VQPTPPKITKIVQEASAGKNSVMTGVSKEVVDKDSEDYVIYQIKLKQYISDTSKYTDNLEKCFSEIIGQCSPGME